MAFGKKLTSALPLAGATAAAMALAGVAVFTVNHAGCADGGRYVQHDGTVELVGGCVNPADLPSAPVEHQQVGKPAKPASNVDPVSP
jgi:hypothetical protein